MTTPRVARAIDTCGLGHFDECHTASSSKWASASHIPVGVLILETPMGIKLDLILC